MTTSRPKGHKAYDGAETSASAADRWFRLEMRQELADADVKNIREEIAALASSTNEFRVSVEASIKGLAESLSQRGRPHWLILIGGATFLLTLMTGLLTIGWFTITQNVQLSLSPDKTNIASMRETQKAHDTQIDRILDMLQKQAEQSLQSSLADEQSRTDRAQLNDRVKTIEQKQADNLAERKAETAALAERSAEVETQFRAEDRIRNVQFAENQRMIALLWNRAYPGVAYPGTAYFPEIAREFSSPIEK